MGKRKNVKKVKMPECKVEVELSQSECDTLTNVSFMVRTWLRYNNVFERIDGERYLFKITVPWKATNEGIGIILHQMLEYTPDSISWLSLFDWEQVILLADYLCISNVGNLVMAHLFQLDDEEKLKTAYFLTKYRVVLGSKHPVTISVEDTFNHFANALSININPDIPLSKLIRDYLRSEIQHNNRTFDESIFKHCIFCNQEIEFIKLSPISYQKALVLPCCAQLLHDKLECLVMYISKGYCYICNTPFINDRPVYNGETLYQYFFRMSLRSKVDLKQPFGALDIIDIIKNKQEFDDFSD